MKKFFIILLIVIVIFISSCTAYGRKDFSQIFTYQDPQTIGGLWTVMFDNGDIYEHLICLYWGTEDDTSTWQLPNGRKLIQSGNIHVIQE